MTESGKEFGGVPIGSGTETDSGLSSEERSQHATRRFKGRKVKHERYRMDLTLMQLAFLIQDKLWLTYRVRKWSPSFIADMLLLGRTTAQAISYGRRILHGANEPRQVFFEVLVAYDNCCHE